MGVFQSGKEEALQRQKIKPLSESGKVETTFALAELASGKYEIRAMLKDEKGVQSMEKVAFQYPPAPPSVPSPAKKILSSLPPASKPVSYAIQLSKGGGFKIIR